MAGGTIGEAAVVESGICPIVGVMAVRTLTVVVVGGRFRGMAAAAIRKASMVEIHRLPIAGDMAVRTLPTVMVDRCIRGVAGLAVIGTRQAVVEINIHPIRGVVAGSAIAEVMVSGRIL